MTRGSSNARLMPQLMALLGAMCLPFLLNCLLTWDAVEGKENDSLLLNISGRQRMYAQKFANEIHRILFSISVQDWASVAALKRQADATAAEWEEVQRLFLEGGLLYWRFADEPIELPPIQEPAIIEALRAVGKEWQALRCAANVALSADAINHADNTGYREFQDHVVRTTNSMDKTVFMIQQSSEERLGLLSSYQVGSTVFAFVLLVVVAYFAQTHIVAPLHWATSKLEEEAAHLEASNRELAASRHRADRAVIAKDEFLANMSHEIRTPMTAILGYADRLADSAGDDDFRDSIAAIRRNGNHLMEIINDILDLSKIEAGKMTVERVECSPLQLVAEVESSMRVRATPAALELCLIPQFPLPKTIKSDPLRLKQVLINLVGNAIKFTEKGSVTIIVSCDKHAEQRALRIAVKDTGVGIEQEALEQLFAAFTQADTSTTRQFGGTGLGLSISQRLAGLLGGKIEAESKPGNGSCFSLVLPLADDVELIDDMDAHAAGINTLPAFAPTSDDALAGLRILLAEDGIDNQRLVKHILSRVGADVDVVENGRLALEALLPSIHGDPLYDVVLMDMQMPEMDGYTATRTLRSLGYSGPIIALTAHAMGQDRDKCLAAGCDEFQIKPFHRAKLIECIRQSVPETSNA